MHMIAPLTAHQRHITGIFTLILFFVIHNIGAVFFQLRGASAAHPTLSLAGYFGGLLLGAFGIRFLERHLDGPRAGLFRRVFLGLMILPGVFCLIAFRITGYEGNLFTNTFQPLLWSLSLPVALRLFFRNVHPDLQLLYFGIAIGIGHLCWALIMPLAHAFGNLVPAGTTGARFLFFLETTRALVCLVFALTCWFLVAPAGMKAETKTGGDAGTENAPPGTGEADAAGRKRETRRLWCLLAPILLCSLLNGFAGYLFFARLVGRGLYPEFMHLGLAFLFPLLGWHCFRKGQDTLRGLLGLAVLGFLFAPLLLLLPAQSGATQAVYLVCAVSQQIFLYGGTLAASRYAALSRVPAITMCAAWLATAAAIPGNIAAAKLLPLLPFSAPAVAWVLAALCAASLLLLRRAFPLPLLPLPPLPSLPDDAALPVSGFPDAPLPENKEKRLDFSAAFGLSAREMEILSGVVRGESMAAIGEKLGITERTARFHLTGLLRKTGLPSRKRLETFYAAWKNDKKD